MAIRHGMTESKENENQLLMLKRALDASNEMIIITDEHGCIQYVNPALCVFTGWKEEEIIGRPTTLFDSSNANPIMLYEMQQCLRQGRSWSGRLLNRRRGSKPFLIAGQTTPPDPLDFWAEINITSIRNDLGELLGYVQIQHDVSEQVDKEQAILMEHADTAARLSISEILQQSLPLEQRFSQVLNCLFDLKAFDLQRKGGVFLKDPELDFLDMFVLHGQFSEEFIRREQRIPYGACLCGRAAISQELTVSDDCFCDPRHDHTFEGMQAHGHYIVPIVSVGATLGILFLYTDPYPVKLESRLNMLQQVGDMLALTILQEQAKKSLETARDAAEQAAKMKAEFLANMSHEIRTPMNGVLGMLDIIKDTELTREQHDLIETASNSAESLLSIINDILDFSKLEAGKIELECIEFCLPLLVEEVCAIIASAAHTKHLELNCFLPPDLPSRWRGDPHRIRQVLTNLIGNAVKFTEHGEVAVKVYIKEVMSDKFLVRFEVKDTGIGISPEVQARLFQPFSQADSTTARRFGGTGLGLSISKNLVTMMDGIMGVESAEGEGANFWFSLPLKAISGTELLPVIDLSNKRALIVDDNATNRKILQHYLVHCGMTVTEAESAHAALELLTGIENVSTPFDVVLTDLHMPNMDGCELARCINQNPTIASIPRILLSSGGLNSEAERLELGFIQTLVKPVRQLQLFDAINSSLQTTNQSPTSTAFTVASNLSDYSRKKVLVVEDNKVNQKVILAMLSKFHCTPDLTENGQQALDKLAQKTYDLVLMDCQMPVMDGYEAVRTLRGQEMNLTGRRTPVIALTAHASIEEKEKCLSAGMDDFLTKPIARHELARVLAHWLVEPTLDELQRIDPSPSTSTVTITSIWDEGAALRNLDDDQTLLQELITLFSQNIPSRLEELSDALARQDLPALADAAHAIKGMVGHFSANTVMVDAATLEECARQSELIDFQPLTQQLIDGVNRLQSALQQKQGTLL